MSNHHEKATLTNVLRTLRGRSSHERILHRLHSVVLVQNGFSCSEVARCYGDSARIVAYWVKRFESDGVSGLREKVRSGRPSKLTLLELKRVAAFVKRESESKGVPTNGKTLSTFIKKTFGVSLTVRQCRRIVNQFPSS